MKKCLWIVCGLVSMLAANAQCETVKSCVINKDQLPIRNQILNPACKLQVTYRFQTGMNVLLCLSNALRDGGTITWPYQGKMHTADLPVILSQRGKDPSTLIDEKGKFSIENNQRRQVVVSCQYSRGVSQAGAIRELIKASIHTVETNCPRNEYFV